MAGALKVHGWNESIESIMEQIRKDRDYYENSGGGVTFSGGEPLAQPDAAVALAGACRAEGFTVYLDTSGFADESVFSRVADAVDGFLYDIKLVDPALHKKYTGVENATILSNFRRAVETGKPVRMRVVLIPGLTDTGENLRGLAELAKTSGFKGALDLMPYHRMGSGKYRNLGMDYNTEDFEPPSDGRLEEVAEYFKGQGICATVQ